MVLNKENQMSNQNDVTLYDVKLIFKNWFHYLFSKWHVFVLVGLFCGALGVLYAAFDKPVYTAELTFTSENEASGNFSAYAGIAAQFGLDMGGSSNSAFEGENLMYLMRSRKLIEKTLFSTVEINKENILLINYYLRVHDFEVPGNKTGMARKMTFTNVKEPNNRNRDSVLQVICKNIDKALDIQKADKKTDIIVVRLKDTHELFAKIFVEELVNKVIQYYTDYKVRKIKQNVGILQRQTDSVRNLISGNIIDIAVSSDLNVNPTRQIVRTGVQRKQVDAQVNSSLYTELVKNLELSKLALLKETPLIQIIDTPMFPLEKKKMGWLKGFVLFGFMGVLFSFAFFIDRKSVV